MHILVLSGAEMIAEFKLKFLEGSNGNAFTFLDSADDIDEQVKGADLVFDFLLHRQPERLAMYTTGQVVFCSAATVQLAALAHPYSPDRLCTLIGFNGLPTLFNREVLEVSLLRPDDAAKLREVCAQLGTDYLLVEDRVGMVTPRILCMIINEACYTLQEKTADVAAIDMGMKLGTNYPKGPFSWANEIGIAHVYQVLEALYLDTKEERYKTCPLLKTKHLKGEQFNV